MYESILTEDVLINDYKTLKMTKAEVARKYNTTIRTVNKYIKKYNIVTTKRREYEDDLSGMIFSRLTVVSYCRNDKHGKRMWNCICQCGKNKVVNGSSLFRGLTTSCGCYAREIAHKGYMDISQSFWRRKQQESIVRKYAFDITPEYVWKIYESQNRKCALIGVPIFFSPNSNKPQENTASIDRVNSQEGYVKGNIQIVHKIVNFCKGWLPDTEFIAMCNLVAQNRRMDHESCINQMSRTVCRKIPMRFGN